MEYKSVGNVIAARLEIGEEIILCVKSICEKENVKSGSVHAIGAISSAEIAMFDFETGEYRSNGINEFMELISLEGNITKMDGEAYIHLHASFGDKNGNVFGGHLKKAVIGATCELFIYTFCEEINRIHDEKTGLNIISLSEAKIQNELREYLIGEGASDVGFAKINNVNAPFPYCVSVCVRLSHAIIEEITDRPTHTYFNHYRSVNFLIDRLLLKAGLFLQERGYDYITVAASQSINDDGWNYMGRFSHKEAARKAGLGSIGKNSLFIHKDFGPEVRLGTLFTDCEFDVPEKAEECLCGDCHICVDACPAKAITGKAWTEKSERNDIFYPEKCSEYMKNNFKNIGRGAVCGICMRVCPKRKEL